MKSSGDIGDGRAGVKPGHFDRYEQGFSDLLESQSATDDRQLIAAVDFLECQQ